MTKPKPLPEIARCPFRCGFDPVLTIHYSPRTDRHQVTCPGCEVRGPRRNTSRGAILAWKRLVEGKK